MAHKSAAILNVILLKINTSFTGAASYQIPGVRHESKHLAFDRNLEKSAGANSQFQGRVLTHDLLLLERSIFVHKKPNFARTESQQPVAN